MVSSSSDSSDVDSVDSECEDELEQLANVAAASMRTKLINSKSKIKQKQLSNSPDTSKTHMRTRQHTKSNSMIDELVETTANCDTFFIDNTPSTSSVVDKLYEDKTRADSSESDSDDDDEADHVEKIDLNRSTAKSFALSSSLQAGVDLSDIYINLNAGHKHQNSRAPQSKPTIIKDQCVDEVMKKSVITPDFEKKSKVSLGIESYNQLKKQKKKAKLMSKGSGWYNLPATELTDERKHDLTVLQMRRALDPKRFYKSNDLHAAPKYFQFGTVVESKAEFYSARIPKKQRKSTMVEELLADAEFRKYNKRKYTEVQEAKRMGFGPYQRVAYARKRQKKHM